MSASVLGIVMLCILTSLEMWFARDCSHKMVCLQFAYQYCRNDFYMFTRNFFFVNEHGITYKKKLFYYRSTL